MLLVLKKLKQLTKMGLVYFVIITASAGYFLMIPYEKVFDLKSYLQFIVGLALLTMGSFAFNQVQEWQLDQKMPRTQSRPIASGDLSPQQGAWIALVLLLIGTVLLWSKFELAAFLSLFTVILYNVFYTRIWKPKWIFGAVPGAIPGALPVVIGVAAAGGSIFSTESIFCFLIMFFWQMPHFWSLALRYAKDYEQGQIPVLPVSLGKTKTLNHIMLYMAVYLALALLYPLFIHLQFGAYYYLVLPFVAISAYEFYVYLKKEKWIRFFLVINFSMLAFLLSPVLDRWLFFYIKT